MRLWMWCLFGLTVPAFAQSGLRERIAAISITAQGTVRVACSLPGVALDCDVDAPGHPPMQSMFKLPLGVVTLRRVERGELRLDQPIDFLKSDTYPGTFSPLQEAHPEGGVEVSLRELLRLSVSQSDNTATDILLRVLGGPASVQKSLDALGFPEIHIRDSERGMHDDDTAQYRNDAEPAALVRLLRMLNDRSPLTPEHTDLLLRWMTESPTSQRIRAGLPAGVVVAHKSGTSGERNGIAAATNDCALITLPDGRRLALAVFVSNARAPMAAREAVIGQIARVVYEAAVAAEAKPGR